MKILYFLTVYKDPDRVLRIIRALQSPQSLFLIHIDKDSKDNFNDLSKYSNVSFTSFRYSTPWGGPELAFAIYEGLKEFQSLEWDYVCLLSESDYPVKSPSYIAEYLNRSQKDHILINPLPCSNPLEIPGGHWLEGGRRRIDCYALRLTNKKIATIEPRKINLGNIRQLFKVLRFNPKKLFNALSIFMIKPKRNSDGIIYCGGHLWFFLRKSTIIDIINFINQNPKFLQDCILTQNLDEIFFPTLVNRVLSQKTEISRDILRYISWKPNKDNSSPVNITIVDKEIINNCLKQSNIMFVRKITDKRVCDYIDYIIESNIISDK